MSNFVQVKNKGYGRRGTPEEGASAAITFTKRFCKYYLEVTVGAEIAAQLADVSLHSKSPCPEHFHVNAFRDESNPYRWQFVRTEKTPFSFPCNVDKKNEKRNYKIRLAIDFEGVSTLSRKEATVEVLRGQLIMEF